jgi:hypothetical protein
MRHIFIGYDPREDIAYKVAERSIHKNARGDVAIHPLRDWELRKQGIYWRGYRVDGSGQMYDERDGKPFSTQFTFTRFCVPTIAKSMGITEPVLFIDIDVMFRADPEELFELWDDTKAVMCVQHNHVPEEILKMDGVAQTRYHRKNWSSVMLIHPEKVPLLTPGYVNSKSGAYLHGLLWTEDHLIGALPEEWNYLVRWSDNDTVPNPKLVHFTEGIPSMPGYEEDEHAEEWRAYARQGPK